MRLGLLICLLSKNIPWKVKDGLYDCWFVMCILECNSFFILGFVCLFLMDGTRLSLLVDDVIKGLPVKLPKVVHLYGVDNNLREIVSLVLEERLKERALREGVNVVVRNGVFMGRGYSVGLLCFAKKYRLG